MNTNPLKFYEDFQGAVLSNLARKLGEKGVLTDEDILRIKVILPQVGGFQRAGDDDFTAQRKVKEIMNLFNRRVEQFRTRTQEQIGNIQNQPNLDVVFHALADSTRRAILSRLADGQASVNEIAAPFEISQPAVSRHLKVLEHAGLIERDIDEQRRPARLTAENMMAAAKWLAEFKAFWGTSFDQLDDLLIQMKQNNEED